MTELSIEPGRERLLRDAHLSDFETFMHLRGEYVASRHETRETVALRLREEGVEKLFFLKRVFRVPPRHAFGPWWRGQRGVSQPRREWDILEQLRQAGIPAMRRVAMGEARVLGVPTRAFLLVEAAPMAHSLEEWLTPGFPRPEALNDEQRDALWREVGSLVRRLAEAGFDWPDLHAKHLFASPVDKGDGWRFCLIDVERMRQVTDRGMAEPIVLDGLARFVHSLRPLSPDSSDLDALLQGAYGTKAADFATRSRCKARLVGICCAGPRLPDDYEHPRAIKIIHHDGVSIRVDALSALKRAGLDHFNGAFAQNIGHKLTKPGLADHRQRLRVDLGNDPDSPRTAFLKRYLREPGGWTLQRFRRRDPNRSPAGREAHYLHKVGALGIATPRVLAWGEEARPGRRRRSFLLLEGLPGESLEALVMRGVREASAVPSWPVRVEIIRQLARVTRRMHDHQLFHRDFYLCHVFLTCNADGGIVLQVIDLARMIHRPCRARRWRVKDLAALDASAPRPLVTRADRLRFLREYYGATSCLREHRREWTAVAGRSRRILERDARRAVSRRREGAA